MITVADILSLPAFSSFEMLAPIEGGMARRVDTVAIMDSAPSGEDYDDFFEGNFVITNLGFARTEQDLAARALCAVMRCDVAAVAVRGPYGVPIPEAAVAASVESGVPLFMCEGDYLEEVSFQALSLIKRDKSDAAKERILESLVEGPSSDEVRLALYRVAEVAGSAVQCAAVRPESSDGCSLYAAMDLLNREGRGLVNRWEGVEDVGLCRYHDAVLLFVGFSKSPILAGDGRANEVMRAFEEDLVSRVASLGAFSCGLSEELPFASAHIAIREALVSLDAAPRFRVQRWRDLNQDAFLAAVSHDELFRRAAMVQQDRLGSCDSDLAKTASAFAEAYGDVKLTAQHLDQHPNTVRYKLRKIKAVLGMPEASDRELARRLGLVYLVR